MHSITRETSDGISFPQFDDIKVSTKTFTATTNITIDIEKVFDILPVTPYLVTPKKRGRKKKQDPTYLNNNIPEGSIITIKYKGELRGVDLKQKKLRSKKKKWFRNSITLVIMLDKPINYKICRNGTFQMTGCKSNTHATQCIKYTWKYIEPHTNIYTFNEGAQSLRALVIPSMRNIDFSLGFLVDREKLNQYMSTQQEFHCLLETCFGYTGVNIKIPNTKELHTMKITRLTCDDGKWDEQMTTYDEYLALLSEKDRHHKMHTVKYNTFLVFHSGKVIMSGLTYEFMKDVYEYFIRIMKRCHKEIEERLEV